VIFLLFSTYFVLAGWLGQQLLEGPSHRLPPTQPIAQCQSLSGSVGILHGCVRRLFSKAAAPIRKDPMADEDLQSELARLRAENEALKQRRSNAVSMKVSEKGAVSVYGLGRFPVTLYQEQWQKLLAMADDIKSFIEENRSRLKVKE